MNISQLGIKRNVIYWFTYFETLKPEKVMVNGRDNILRGIHSDVEVK
jgi:hypothetical protein